MNYSEWTHSKLEDICTVITDGTHKTPTYVNDGIRFISIANIRPFQPLTFEKYEKFITEDEHQRLCKRVAPQKNDILFSRIGTLGYAKIVDFGYPVSIFVGLGLARPRPNLIYPKFLEYYMNTRKVYRFSVDNAKGTGRLTLPLEASRKMPISYPPLPEQERIVSRIEELFSQLDAGVATLKKTKAQLGAYRQAVLKEAFEVLPSIVTLGSMTKMIDPHPSHRTPPVFENGIPYIGIGDIDYKIRQINFESARKVNPTILTEHLDRYTIQKGDFVMGKIGTIGKPFRLPLPQKYALSANVILIQPDNKIVNPEFLFWQFSSVLVTEQLLEGKNETSQPAFGIQKARLIKIKLCKMDEQNMIVKNIREKMSVCDSIEQTTDAALQQSESLRQSILKEAFEGRL